METFLKNQNCTFKMKQLETQQKEKEVIENLTIVICLMVEAGHLLQLPILQSLEVTVYILTPCNHNPS